MITFTTIEAVSDTSYGYLLDFVTNLSTELQKIGFTEKVAPSVSANQGTVTMSYNGYDFAFTQAAANYRLQTSITHDGNVVGAISNKGTSANDLKRAKVTLVYAKSFGPDFIFGFNAYNQSGYRFDCGFVHLNDTDTNIEILPTSLSTVVDMKLGAAADGSWRDMYNVSVSDPDKGLLRQFYKTKADTYLDMDLGASSAYYNIQTGFTFTLHSPVTINGEHFIPLNSYTLFKYI